MYTEVHAIADLLPHLRAGSLDHVVVQGLDLCSIDAPLRECSAAGAVFLGCIMTPASIAHVQDTGGVLFPRLPDLPYNTFRPRLYTIEELMAGYLRGQHQTFFSNTCDSRIYKHYKHHARPGIPAPVLESLAQRLHDHAIDDALSDLLHENDRAQRVIGVMGGHAMRRDEPAFLAVAQLGRRLSQAGLFVATGGGPGAMEAANLGAWLQDASEQDVKDAVSILAQAPAYKDPGWFDTAYAVKDRWPDGAESLAIPTWFYGHEPSNLFARHVAKYFANSLREDGLLAIATRGVIFAPGSAGTIQEIFMDAAQNHYATFHTISPMVFLNRRYWTEKKPVYPLLQQLAAGRKYGEMLTISDDVQQVVDFILAHPPVTADS